MFFPQTNIGLRLLKTKQNKILSMKCRIRTKSVNEVQESQPLYIVFKVASESVKNEDMCEAGY